MSAEARGSMGGRAWARRGAAGLAAGLAALAWGCATVVPPKEVKVAVAVHQQAAPAIVDARAPEAKVYREDTSQTSVSKYFGDDTLQPAFADLLAHRLADSLPAGMQGARIELRRADIGYWIYLGSSPMMPAYTPYGVPIGPALIGNLIGLGIVYGVRRAAANENAVAYIEIAVDGETVPATESVAIKDGKAEEAVREAVSKALDTLASRVARLGTAPE